MVDRAHTGRPRSSTSREDRILVRIALANCKKTLSQLKAEWGVHASRYIIRRRLLSAGLKARSPWKKPYLNLVQPMQNPVGKRTSALDC